MNLEKNTHHHHGQHENRPDLAGEYKYGDAGQLILAVIFLIVWVLDSFIFTYSTFLNENLKWYVQVIPGMIILAIAGYLARAGLKMVFGEIREKPEVITKGVFSIVRHPVYLGSILTYLGMIVLTLSLFSVIIWIIAIVFYYYISRHEEKLLIAKFGKEYEDYMKKVPMLFPLKV
ncbi:MAG: hypothetical protein AMS27_01660 [Bacteroides sp. SM23_62_1]|nr:MAG: hypothetical protein AMS27_01660 [Bacteroides sp. SM23_62_1]